MSHLNDHRSTVSLVERYIGTPYDQIKIVADALPDIIEIINIYNTTSGVDRNLTFTQSVPSAIWVVTHNFNKFPSVETVDSNKEEIEGEVVHISSSQLEIRFNTAVSGFAYVN